MLRSPARGIEAPVTPSLPSQLLCSKSPQSQEESIRMEGSKADNQEGRWRTWELRKKETQRGMRDPHGARDSTDFLPSPLTSSWQIQLLFIKVAEREKSSPAQVMVTAMSSHPQPSQRDAAEAPGDLQLRSSSGVPGSPMSAPTEGI